MESRIQMIKILWSIHNSAWLLIWMDRLFDRRKYIDSNKKFWKTTLIISKKPGNTGISRDIRTEFTTDLLLSD